MTAQSAAEASRKRDGKGVSPAYWRDVERGHGGRRGQRVPTRASARALAAMARVVGVQPAQLTGAGREDAARVLEEIMRREGSVPAADAAGAADALAVTRTPPPRTALGIDEDDPRWAPYIREVRAELAAATAEYGPGHTGAEAFTAANETVLWDDPLGNTPNPDDRVLLIAYTRHLAAEYRQQHRRTGLKPGHPADGLGMVTIRGTGSKTVVKPASQASLRHVPRRAVRGNTRARR